ncbi:MAG: uncharacterized protein KVP18_001552 [Porospora cf. gigantea A]|uniref:uncharacterized protein n=1 Tax=Porospora cf. gigantea A TaxID=2853593 RepID=UPI003559DD89|nr:MAG: hypothetical protein KVP18_001552 [Porospora cf. gigantea A]
MDALVRRKVQLIEELKGLRQGDGVTLSLLSYRYYWNEILQSESEAALTWADTLLDTQRQRDEVVQDLEISCYLNAKPERLARYLDSHGWPAVVKSPRPADDFDEVVAKLFKPLESTAETEALLLSETLAVRAFRVGIWRVGDCSRLPVDVDPVVLAEAFLATTPKRKKIKRSPKRKSTEPDPAENCLSADHPMPTTDVRVPRLQAVAEEPSIPLRPRRFRENSVAPPEPPPRKSRWNVGPTSESRFDSF